MQLIDNQVDARSGTVRVRAVFANADGSLMPGQFARLHMGQPKSAPALAVNERAVGIKLEEIEGKPVVAIAGGEDKPQAIMASLESRVIKGLVTDEATAKTIVETIDAGAKAGGLQRAKR